MASSRSLARLGVAVRSLRDAEEAGQLGEQLAAGGSSSGDLAGAGRGADGVGVGAR